MDGLIYISLTIEKKQVDDTRMPLHRSGLEDSSISLRQKIALPLKTWRSDYYKLPAWNPPGTSALALSIEDIRASPWRLRPHTHTLKI